MWNEPLDIETLQNVEVKLEGYDVDTAEYGQGGGRSVEKQKVIRPKLFKGHFQ